MAGVSAVCLGESMAVLVAGAVGPLEDIDVFHRAVGGAESNVARGLVALGVPAAWISRVGDDGFGRCLLAEIGSGGVDTSAVGIDATRPTGLYIKELLTGHRSRMYYYRAGSAASAMGPDLYDEPRAAALLAGAGVIHLSGITAALSDSCLALLREVLARRRDGQLVSFDLNWRPALWRDRDPAALQTLANTADVVLAGADEAATVFGTGDPHCLRDLLPGPGTLLIKDDARRATAVDRTGTAVAEPALTVDVVEPIGAGDAFAAGYLAGVLRGYDQRRRLRLGHLAAAATLVVPGDHGPPPPDTVIEALLACPAADWAATTVTSAGVDSPALGTVIA